MIFHIHVMQKIKYNHLMINKKRRMRRILLFLFITFIKPKSVIRFG